jgi:CBS domain-containing protein
MRFFARTPAPGTAAAAAPQAGSGAAPSPAFATIARYDVDPRLATVARPARAVGPDTRLGFVAEVLRMSPYRAVPIVDGDPDGPQGARLIGLVREQDLLGALLRAPDGTERARVREQPARSIMVAPIALVTPSTRVSEAARLLDQSGADVLPVVDAFDTYLGLAARSDLVQDLVRPFRPPVVGGMATPLGVYLTTGAVSGGAGTLALVLTGLALFSLHLVGQGLGEILVDQIRRVAVLAFGIGALRAAVPGGLADFLEQIVPQFAQFALFLLLLRLSPISGYHAAEHQVVHAIERAEPLAVETVRAMPRVHPRCGTNLVAGMMILLLGGTLLLPLAGDWGYVLSGIVALAYWRSLGAWLQQHFTTRPATDAQIQSGIVAARQLLAEHGRAPFVPPHKRQRPLVRLWRMGFVQILCGFLIGYGLLALASLVWPPLRTYFDVFATL